MSDFEAKIHQIQFPRWGSLQRSPRPPSWWGGGSLPPPKNPTPALGPSGLALRPFGPQYSVLRASKFGPSGLNLPPQILKASAVPASKRAFPTGVPDRWQNCLRIHWHTSCLVPAFDDILCHVPATEWCQRYLPCYLLSVSNSVCFSAHWPSFALFYWMTWLWSDDVIRPRYVRTLCRIVNVR